MNINPLLDVDFYKVSHKHMYPRGMTKMYSNLTPRSAKHFRFKSADFDNRVVVFGTQALINQLANHWQTNFFNKPIEPLVAEYKSVLLNCLGVSDPDVQWCYDLHNLGYLPILIKALPEGSRSPIGVPVLTIANTHDNFAWLVNYLETYLSTNIWKPITMATNSYEYKRILAKYNALTADTTDFMPWQVHDFAARGLGSSHEWAINCIAHLTSFSGTDTVQAILGAQHYYGADLTCGGSVPATEHSVMTINISTSNHDDKLLAEQTYLHKLLTDLYPTGILSVVCDSYDFWGVIEHNLPALKDVIMYRDGKLVIRPDSGNPIDVICGVSVNQSFNYDLEEAIPLLYMGTTYFECNSGTYKVKTIVNDEDEYESSYTKITEVEARGLLQSLWDIFGGTLNDKGYKVLDSHIGLIYGDAITADVYESILSRMESMGFSSDNLVIGKGAVGDQLITRDTFGFAIKATHCVVNGQSIEVSKEPKTDAKKKSAKGLLHVTPDFQLIDQCTPEQEATGLLEPIFHNSEVLSNTTLEEIRQKLN